MLEASAKAELRVQDAWSKYWDDATEFWSVRTTAAGSMLKGGDFSVPLKVLLVRHDGFFLRTSSYCCCFDLYLPFGT